jgi:MFS family permease
VLRMGPYFCADQINVSQHEIIQLMQINTTQFSWLNSVSSLVSIIIAPICGPLMDRYSTSVGLYLGMLAMVLSQLLAMFAINIHNYTLMVLSKLLFGIGFQPMLVGKEIIMSDWFFGAELSLANNFNQALS